VTFWKENKRTLPSKIAEMSFSERLSPDASGLDWPARHVAWLVTDYKMGCCAPPKISWGLKIRKHKVEPVICLLLSMNLVAVKEYTYRISTEAMCLLFRRKVRASELLFLVSTNAFGRQGLHGLRDEAICGTIM
jgi:hypothetical protein